MKNLFIDYILPISITIIGFVMASALSYLTVKVIITIASEQHTCSIEKVSDK